MQGETLHNLTMDIFKKITNFLFELNEAKRVPRSGWHRLGIKNAESVADHLALTGQIAFVLAQMENANAPWAATLALFHDVGEIRTGDEDWISRIYKNKDDSEEKAFLAQIDGLPVNGKFADIYREIKEKKTKEAIIVKDADLLELAIQAKVYERSGYHGAPIFIDGMRDNLKTKSAKKLLGEIEKGEIEDWWLAIPEIVAIKKKTLETNNKQ